MLDYHKGAHALELLQAAPQAASAAEEAATRPVQRLRVTEHDSVFDFDLVATLFGGANAPLSRTIYILVGLAAGYQALNVPGIQTRWYPANA